MRQLAIHSVKVGHAFTTYFTGQHILMSVNESINALLSQFINKAFHSVQVSVIILTWGEFNGFPHDTETYKVESPAFQVIDL